MSFEVIALKFVCQYRVMSFFYSFNYKNLCYKFVKCALYTMK